MTSKKIDTLTLTSYSWKALSTQDAHKENNQTNASISMYIDVSRLYANVNEVNLLPISARGSLNLVSFDTNLSRPKFPKIFIKRIRENKRCEF